MIRVGTSGYSYEDWVGPFYPEGLPKRDRLVFYAREFSTCEVNFSYYRIPTARTLAAMARKVPNDFLFTIKASKEMTHERENQSEAFSQFRQALLPWIEEHKLGCILAQFPFSFHNTPQNRDYLKYLREHLSDLPVVVEFRNVAWLKPETFELLERLNLGFCCVDQPLLEGLLPPIAKVTGSIAYVRFHGRNYRKWWDHRETWERYDYTYRIEELEEWVPKIQEMDQQAERTFVFANNHWRGQAVDTARQLRILLRTRQATHRDYAD